MALKDDIDTITRQEQALLFPRLDENTAFQLGTMLRDVADRHAYGITIDIRKFDQQLFFAALPGTTPENIDWMRRKINVVKHFHKSSYRVGLELKLKGTTLEARSGLPVRDYAAHGGSFPLHVQGSGIIGAVTISGLPQRQDHEFVAGAIAALLKIEYAPLALGPEE